MPKITLNGKGPTPPRGASSGPRSGNRPTGPAQSFGDVLSNAIAQGTAMDPAMLQNAQFSPAYQSNAWKSVADRAAYDRVAAAIQSLRRGGGLGSDAVIRAQQGFSTYRSAAGGSLPQSAAQMEAALQRVMRSVATRPSGGALVPYQGGAMQVYRSPNTGFQMVGGPTSPMSTSTDVTRYLGRIDASTRQSAKVETDSWNRNKQIALATPIPMGGRGWNAGSAGPQYTGYGAGNVGAPGFGSPGGPMWGAPGFWQRAGFGGGAGGGGGGIPLGPTGAPLGGVPRGGGGGGSGGSIGRRARGYGWGKAISRIPYVGGALSNIVEAGALGGPWAAAAATAVEAADFAVFNKQYVGNIARGVQGNAQPFMDFQGSAFALGRAGGYSGQETMDQFYKGWNTPELMKRYGATPEDAMRDINRFGIIQSDPQRNASLFEALNEPKYSAAFSGMNQDAVKGSAGAAARYGVVTGDAAGVTKYLNMLAPVMEGATARGMDRASILKSIDASIAGAATRGAAGIDVAGNVGFMSQFSRMPGGRTGEIGLSVAASLDNAAGSVGSAPAQSMAYGLAVRRYSTQADLEKLLGHPLSSTEQDVADYYFQAIKGNNTQAAAAYLSALTTGNPAAEQRILAGPGSPASMMPGMYRPLAIKGATGASLTESVAMSKGRSDGWASSSPAPGGSQAAARDSVMQRLMVKYGYTKEQAAGVAGNIAMENNAYDPSRINPSGHTGLVQWDTRRRAAIESHFSKSMLSMSKEEQTDAIAWELSTDGPESAAGNALRGAKTPEEAARIFNEKYERSANPGTPAMLNENANRSAAARSAYSGYGGVSPDNIPRDANTLTSTAGAAGMRGSEESLTQGAVMLPLFVGGLQAATTALERFGKALSGAVKAPTTMTTPEGGAFGPYDPSMTPQ